MTAPTRVFPTSDASPLDVTLLGKFAVCRAPDIDVP